MKKRKTQRQAIRDLRALHPEWDDLRGAIADGIIDGTVPYGKPFRSHEAWIFANGLIHDGVRKGWLDAPITRGAV